MKKTILVNLLLLFPNLVLAEEAGLNSADTAWILTSTALVLFMTLPGLALFYGGLVRTKNVLSILMQCFSIAGTISILWLIVGYSLAFGEGNAWLGDLSKVSAAAGAMTWMFIEWIRFGKPSALGAVTGMVAGLGTITPASGFVGPGGALIIGLLAGAVCFTATQYLKRVLKIDDSLDVFPVHGVGGMMGTLLAGVFSSTQLGVFSGYGFADGISSMGGQLSVQLTAVLATVAFTAVMTFVILKVVGVMIGGLRVDEEQEVEGLDIVCHEETGYNL